MHSLNMSSSLPVDSPLLVKVVVLGDMNIGAKTSLIMRFVYDEFKTYEPTIGAAFIQTKILVQGVEVKLDVWGL